MLCVCHAASAARGHFHPGDLKPSLSLLVERSKPSLTTAREKDGKSPSQSRKQGRAISILHDPKPRRVYSVSLTCPSTSALMQVLCSKSSTIDKPAGVPQWRKHCRLDAGKDAHKSLDHSSCSLADGPEMVPTIMQASATLLHAASLYRSVQNARVLSPVMLRRGWGGLGCCGLRRHATCLLRVDDADDCVCGDRVYDCDRVGKTTSRVCSLKPNTQWTHVDNACSQAVRC